ncbi:SIMPL domain-containing protein [Agromyces indicus]|uniref:SIMPL domain-containing protein n=1 Tax=Agromyces indicus TaxID=758919 RepID=A0ABU1FKK8_9MICO|nr:SIMPL domain-containing protein [Agromyces indicus]MDR5691931.1 SIMPL domain-containing protein [Agromyces indicus]
MATVIAVSGRAEVRIEPELGAVSLTVGSSGGDREPLLRDVAEAHERLLEDVRELEASGVLDTWSAGQLRVWSHRPWNAEGRQLPLVHQANADVEVVFSDLSALGGWLGRVTGAPHLTLGGIEWRLTDATRDRVLEEAQRAAVADAVRKAAVYAEALGLGAPVAIELADSGMLTTPQPMPRPHQAVMMRAMALDGAPEAEIAPAKLVMEASVDARFHAD